MFLSLGRLDCSASLNFSLFESASLAFVSAFLVPRYQGANQISYHNTGAVQVSQPAKIP